MAGEKTKGAEDVTAVLADKAGSVDGGQMVTLPKEVLDELMALLKSQRQAPVDSVVMKALEASAAQAQTINEQMRRATRRSNASHPGVSAYTFNPKCASCLAGMEHTPGAGDLAHPKPDLKYPVTFCHHALRADTLTPLEVELLNSFETSCETRNGLWSAVMTRTGSKPRLDIVVPAKTLDHLMDLPPLVTILTELLYGDKIIAETELVKEVIELRKKVAAMEARQGIAETTDEDRQRANAAKAGMTA